jgi:hypothetical protein
VSRPPCAVESKSKRNRVAAGGVHEDICSRVTTGSSPKFRLKPRPRNSQGRKFRSVRTSISFGGGKMFQWLAAVHHPVRAVFAPLHDDGGDVGAGLLEN